MMNEQNFHIVLQGILDVGEEMMVAGAEIYRVEDSIERMCNAYGANPGRSNVFIITSNIQVTIEAPDGSIITQIRRILRSDVNFDRLARLNDLCRRICATTPDVDELQAELNKIMSKADQRWPVKFLGGILAASFFAIFFGGSVMDAVATGIIAVPIVLLQNKSRLKNDNKIVFTFYLSVIAGVLSHLMAMLGIGDSCDHIMIGCIMLLIPGIALTNSARDILMGDTASGLLRFADSLINAVVIACGFALSMVLLRGLI